MKMIKYYLGLSLLFLTIGVVSATWWVTPFAIWTGVSLLCVTLAYIFNKPGIFRKRQDGSIPTAIRWVFWPFLVGANAYNWFARKYDKVPPIQKVDDDIFLACRLFASDIETLLDNEVTAILDVTAEFDGLDWSSQDASLAYLNIPVLDHTSPEESQLLEAVEWINKQTKGNGKVVIHCALGRGRSVLVTAACLLSRDPELTVQDAMNKIQTARETARLNKRQLKSLKKMRAEGGLRVIEKIGIVANPVSGGGKWKQHKQYIVEQLSTRYELEIKETTPEVSAKMLAKDLKDSGFKLIVACGGDGTLAEVAQVMVGSDCTMGIIPLGTANALSMVLFGSNSKLSPVSTACDAILKRDEQYIDTAVCNGTTALLVCGFGVESEMIKRSDRGEKDSKGQLAYLQYFMSSLMDSKTYDLRITLDDKDEQLINVKSLTVANAAPPSTVLAQGGGNPNIQDGVLDVCWFDGDQTVLENLTSVAGLTMSGLLNNQHADAIVFSQCKKMTIHSDQPIDFVLDGEVYNAEEVTIEVRPSSLRMICSPEILNQA